MKKGGIIFPPFNSIIRKKNCIMKAIKKISFFLLVLILIRCGEPSPTELYDTAEEENLQVQAISTDGGTYVNSKGYDSTGIVDPVINKSTIISVTGVRNTNYGSVQSEGYYYAVFNDKSKPVKTKNGKMIGYKSKTFSSVKFNNFDAVQIPYIVRYMDKMMLKDTLLGVKYFIKQRMMGRVGQMSGFPFASMVNFRVEENRHSFTQINIVTPSEIIGGIKLDGNRLRKNLNFILEWNAKREGTVEIIIAVYKEKNGEAIPLIKLKGNDNGRIRVPYSIIENALSNQNKIIVISFIRKIEKEITNDLLNDTYIVAQSIHNIRIEIP